MTLAWLAVAVFLVAYVLVVLEEALELKKSKPVVIAAGLIWILVGLAFPPNDNEHAIAVAEHALTDYCKLLIFLLVSITFVNVLEERRAFAVLRSWLTGLGLNYLGLFWAIGLTAFVLSIVLANMTTAMVLGVVVLGVGRGNAKFITLCCLNIVVAANAGGAFCPFGDVTSLMVWQAGKLNFLPFFKLFLPALASWIIPALLMSLAIPKGAPERVMETQRVKAGTATIIFIFAFSIVLAAAIQSILGIPAVFGMVTGLGFLQAHAFFLQRRGHAKKDNDIVLDSFAEMSRIDWDTLLFFFGIIMSLAGLEAFGLLADLQSSVYGGLGTTWANSLIGMISAILDNVPMVYAVLKMNPQMDQNGWLLLTLCAGIGGSLLSVGSAAGVALMGLAGKDYTFVKHLRWMPAIALGYLAAIGVHLTLN